MKCCELDWISGCMVPSQPVLPLTSGRSPSRGEGRIRAAAQRCNVTTTALTLATVALAFVVAPGTLSAADIRFNRDIRPILSETSFRCHGPDSAARQAELRFDRREVAISKGAITPGKPEKS